LPRSYPATFEDILVEKLREELAPVREEPVKVLDSKTIDKGGVGEFTVESAGRHSALIVTVKATYDPNATKGVRVRWLYSADGESFDSPEDAEDAGNFEDLTFEAGKTRQRTLLIPLFQRYTKVQIVNLDASYSVVVDVWRTFLR